jgi:hypothetical protein
MIRPCLGTPPSLRVRAQEAASHGMAVEQYVAHQEDLALQV